MKVIAIDGTASAGKGITSKLLAQKLGYLHIDTGSIYRAIALCTLQNGYNENDLPKINKMLNSTKIELKKYDCDCHIFINSIDKTVTGELRAPEVSSFVPKIAKHPSIRARVQKIQHSISKYNNIVIEGRDTTTEVFPNAFIKFFLTASIEVRAKRRQQEYEQKGIKTDYETVKRAVITRDKEDTERKVSPLYQAKDAILIDNSDLTIEQTVEKMYNLIIEKENKK